MKLTSFEANYILGDENRNILVKLARTICVDYTFFKDKEDKDRYILHTEIKKSAYIILFPFIQLLAFFVVIWNYGIKNFEIYPRFIDDFYLYKTIRYYREDLSNDVTVGDRMKELNINI